MRQFFDNCKSTGRIRLRDALAGGRTEVFQMRANADDNHTLKDFDVQSLYPYILFSKMFPVSQPNCQVCFDILSNKFNKTVLDNQ